MRCPYAMAKNENQDWCELTAKPSGRIHPCLLMSGDTCEEWEEYKKGAKDNE